MKSILYPNSSVRKYKGNVEVVSEDGEIMLSLTPKQKEEIAQRPMMLFELMKSPVVMPIIYENNVSKLPPHY